MGSARILLADADAFFVAVARMADPEGAGKADLLIVGGSSSGRGVVCSASYEARRFGVRSAMPTSRALRLCPQAMVVPVPGKLCSVKHREVRAVLERWSPVVSAASIDEWYCDLRGTEALYQEPLADTTHRMRDEVRRETGLPVSFGGGSNRLIAKLAVEVAKPRPGTGATGVHIVDEGQEAEFLQRFALGDIPGVGPKSQARLAKLGLRTVPELLAHDLATLTRWLGENEARWLYDRARGIGDDAVGGPHDSARQISREETFPVDIGDDASLERELLALVSRASANLRDDGRQARTISVKLRDKDFTTRSAARTLPQAVVSDRAIFEVARELLHGLRKKRRVPARLIGVALSSFDDPGGRQLALFDSDDTHIAGDESERDRLVSRTIDSVRKRFGGDAIGLGLTSDD